jgi:hypothetical protein
VLPARVLKNQHSLILPSSSLILSAFSSQRRHQSECCPAGFRKSELWGVIGAMFCITPYLLRLSFPQVAHLLSRFR